jgi:hypothetical protein
LKLMKGEGPGLAHVFVVVVHDGAVWDKDHAKSSSTDAWYMFYDGPLRGSVVMGKRTMTLLALSRKANL